MITIDDFRKVELRTAKVFQVDPHPNADRLWVLQLEVGAEKRQIVAGIRQHYTAEQLLGKTIVMAFNLQPAMLRGVESQGMLLAVRDGEKVVALTTDVPTATGLLVS